MDKKIQPFFEDTLEYFFGEDYKKIFDASLLLRYLEIKTKSVAKSSKSRANFGNLYAIYVLIEDYLNNKFDEKGGYSSYGGAQFVRIFKRQRELPFGEKLQNHALNHRCNQEFEKFFPKKPLPIIRNLDTKRYWINEKLLIVEIDSKKYNIAKASMGIIDRYISERIKKSSEFLKTCQKFEKSFDKDEFVKFVRSQLEPTVDARIFEIVSFVILKNYYAMKRLTLYKTGRTNANDGGIDFVMRPAGRFFQVTEVLDFRKYFLDIDKIHRYPITFVIKSTKTPEEIMVIISKNAEEDFPDKETLKKYLIAIEEIIPIPILLERLNEIIKNNKT